MYDQHHHKNFTNVSGFALIAVFLVAMIVILLIKNAVIHHHQITLQTPTTSVTSTLPSTPLSHTEYENIVQSNDQLRKLADQLESINIKLSELTALNNKLLTTGNHLTSKGFDERVQKAVDKRLQQIKNSRYGKYKSKYCASKHKKKKVKCNKRHHKGKRR